MTARLVFVLTLLLALLCACDPTMYGVPQQRWETMGEPARVEVMRLYEERQRADAEASRRSALERERQAAQQAADAQRTRDRLAS